MAGKGLTQELLAKIKKWSKESGVPFWLTISIIRQESGFNPNAINVEYDKKTGQYRLWERYKQKALKDSSFAKWWNVHPDKDDPKAWGSFGLMQILPTTAHMVGFSKSVHNSELFIPDVNLKFGTRYLAQLWKKYGNVKDTASHYNSGLPYAQALAKAQAGDTWRQGTINVYVPRVEDYSKQYKTIVV